MAANPQASLDPIDLIIHASGVVLVVLVLLILCATMVWGIWLLKTQQLRRLSHAQDEFEEASAVISDGNQLIETARRFPDAPGARVVLELAKRRASLQSPSSELYALIARRALATETQGASSLMAVLSSIASTAPFIGLFGTVWGIMSAFLKIGLEKSASLPVVAPAIGEALVATAVGLVAAIPATLAYNFVDKRIGDLIDTVTSSTEAFAELLAQDDARYMQTGQGHASAPPVPLTSRRSTQVGR